MVVSAFNNVASLETEADREKVHSKFEYASGCALVCHFLGLTFQVQMVCTDIGSTKTRIHGATQFSTESSM